MNAPHFTVSDSGLGSAQRKTPRTTIPGLAVRRQDEGAEYAVRDLSSSGFALLDPAGGFAEGDSAPFDLFLMGKPIVQGVGAKVVRLIANGLVGFDFESLAPHQEERLERLVLDVKKRRLALGRAKASRAL